MTGCVLGDVRGRPKMLRRRDAGFGGLLRWDVDVVVCVVVERTVADEDVVVVVVIMDIAGAECGGADALRRMGGGIGHELCLVCLGGCAAVTSTR